MVCTMLIANIRFEISISVKMLLGKLLDIFSNTFTRPWASFDILPPRFARFWEADAVVTIPLALPFPIVDGTQPRSLFQYWA